MTDQRALQQYLGNACAFVDDAVPHDGVGDLSPRRDRHVGPDDGVVDYSPFLDDNRRDDDAAGDLRHGRLEQDEQVPVCLEQRFRVAAVPPVLDWEGVKRLALFDHALQAVGQLVLALDADPGVDDLLQAVKQEPALTQVINPDDGQVARRVRRFLHQPPYPVTVKLHDAKLPRVRHPAHADGAAARLEGRLEVRLKDGVAEHDEHRLLGRNGLPRQVDRVPETLSLRLLDGGHLELGIRPLDVLNYPVSPLA